MPLYKHKDGEQVRTVPGSYEDRRLADNPEWERVKPAAPPAGQDRAVTGQRVRPE